MEKRYILTFTTEFRAMDDVAARQRIEGNCRFGGDVELTENGRWKLQELRPGQRPRGIKLKPSTECSDNSVPFVDELGGEYES